MSPGMGSEEDDRGSPFSPSASASRPRLVIKEMVLRNFKSYAGEQRIGPFHKVRRLEKRPQPTGDNGTRALATRGRRRRAGEGDEKLKLAFFAALGNTVVAEDLDQATRIAYGRDQEFRRVVTLEGALFEKSGTMSGGGSRPLGGKMGTSIPVSISGEDAANAEEELSQLVGQLNSLRQRISDCVKRYRGCEKAEAHLEMELAKTNKEVGLFLLQCVDSLNEHHRYVIKQLESLKVASNPKKDELNRLKELDNVISAEQSELEKLGQCSSTLKERNYLVNVKSTPAANLQKKIENAGGEPLKNQKSKVARIQAVDAEYKLQDARKLKKEWEMKVKASGKRLDDIQIELVKHMDLLDEFMAGFNIISLKLKEMYQMITLGGDAELELVDSLDPFSEGVVFSVRPPKKSWKNIANLSGGEKV
ncbi:hypothetical protein GW17_00016185 [Ensete ventricosum]|nr:hypothetical protein GW17_00016185 [Ensete ventricosum]